MEKLSILSVFLNVLKKILFYFSLVFFSIFWIFIAVDIVYWVIYS